MEIKKIKTTKEYLSFIKKLYKKDKFYKDNKSEVINMICNKKSPFYRNTFQEMTAIVIGNEVKCQTVFIQHKNSPETLMLAFFEAEKEAKKEVECLINYAKAKAIELGCKKILVAMNGHCNYGLGILTNNFNNFPNFGEAYNSDYYKDFFQNNFKIYKFHNYKNSLAKVGEKISKFTKRLSLQNIDFKYYDAFCPDFDNAIKIYNDLNNTIFKEHLYYFKRELDEDKELFYSMKPLLLNKNLIIAYKNNIPIGFLLWYPDYNELVNSQKHLSLFALLKYKLFNRKPKHIMLTEIGVLPDYENTGLAISLFLNLHDYLYKQYDKNIIVCSGWIFDKNLKSKNLVQHILEKTDKEFCIYELSI